MSIFGLTRLQLLDHSSEVLHLLGKNEGTLSWQHGNLFLASFFCLYLDEISQKTVLDLFMQFLEVVAPFNE